MSRHIEGEPSQYNSQFRQELSSAVENATIFLRVSPQLHLINLAGGLVGGTFIVEDITGGRYISAAMFGALWGWNIAINELKAINNVQHYRKVKHALDTHGWDERAVEPMLNWWCDRYAARRAAIDAGHKEEIIDYYKEKKRSWLKVYQR